MDAIRFVSIRFGTVRSVSILFDLIWFGTIRNDCLVRPYACVRNKLGISRHNDILFIGSYTIRNEVMVWPYANAHSLLGISRRNERIQQHGIHGAAVPRSVLQ